MALVSLKGQLQMAAMAYDWIFQWQGLLVKLTKILCFVLSLPSSE